MRLIVLLLCIALPLAGEANLPAPIPARVFAQGPQIEEARLSPDGRYIASLREDQGQQWLIVFDLQEKKNYRIDPGRTVDGWKREVAGFRWISNRRISFVTTVWDGQYVSGVSAVDCDGRNWVAFSGYDAFPNSDAPLAALAILHSFGDKNQDVLMVDRGNAEGADLVYPDVVRVSTLKKTMKPVVKNPGNVVYWVPDHAGVVRIGITRENLRWGVIYREDEKTPWRTLPLLDAERGQIMPLGFDYDGRRLIVVANNDEKRRAVYYYDLQEGKLGEVIASHPQFDIIPDRGGSELDGVTLSDAVLSELTKRVIGIRYVTEGPRVTWFDPSFDSVQAGLDRMLPHTVNLIVSSAEDEKRFVVLSYSDRDPGTYYLVDTRGEKPVVTRLGARLTDFPIEAMRPMHPIKYPSRAGDTIHGYLTLPPGGAKRNLPLVVMPHGGPFVRDEWGFDPWVQFLANRGYAVLQMNFRGSPGYGVEFYRKGRREIGRGMQDDIEDGTRWAIAQGVADPRRIAILGGSYGGYAALFALGHDPELYRCGVSINGVTDWLDISKERRGEEYKYAYLHFKEWIGDQKLDHDFLASISPVNFADKITAPVLIIQGREDKTVPPKQARRMAEALEKAGRPPQTIYFPNEGHSFADEKNRTKVFEEVERFLARHLGTK